MDFKKIIMFTFAALMLVACASAPANHNDETRARANEAYQEVDAE